MNSRVFFLLLIWAVTASAADGERSFDQWLGDIRQTALKRGIGEETVKRAFAGLEPDPRVIGFDRNQPEFQQTFEEYLDARVNDFRIEQGRRLYKENRQTLEEIAEHYDVAPQYLVAFWGLESSFGRHQGKYSVIRSLATLAYDPRRSRFFTEELMAALRILDQGHVSLDEFVGGWAGAMGQNQFLPSSFLNYAQDFDGDGRKNIWSSRQDVWASIANYLQRNGWQRGAGWGFAAVLSEPLAFDTLRPASVPAGCRALRHHTRRLPW
ncbi:MAG: lytic murein transglycosylase [Pseudomonadales bacterium]|nr:lytic murein transglycosylase [Pseudomonadales bacterium]